MLILGIDEVGRGSLAGPLVVGAVALDVNIRGVKDSKLLARTKREELAKKIELRAKYVGLGWVSAAEIDLIGLTFALKLASQQAINGANLSLIDEIIIDGNINFLPEIKFSRTLINADAFIPAVSAASIIAKVARDNYMREIAEEHNLYGFETNVGYGTLYHLKALQAHGPCRLHRRSFDPLKSTLLESTVSTVPDPVFATATAR